MARILQDDTIVAIATPPGEGGIGIIRISGPQAPQVLQQVWQGRCPAQFESHRLYRGSMVDPESGHKLDEGLAVWMQAPRSYTGEEVVELHAHGGPLVLNRIQDVFVKLGLRVAEPGEFTRRAFLNGKLDLLQAEAVGEMIHAKSEAALQNARSQLEGRLSHQVQSLRQQLITLLARVEAAIDFPEEDIEIIAPQTTFSEIASIETTLEDWLKKFQLGRLVREGVRVALVGRPNVGKSSLLNRLLGEDKAIVHPTPGTTRDVVEGWMEIQGIGFQLYDTAGIRQGQEPVEQVGIERSKKMAQQADVTLWVLDVSQPLSEEDRLIADTLQGSILLVGNKADLGVLANSIPENWRVSEDLRALEWNLISAKTGEGMAALQQALLHAVGLEALGQRSEAFLNNARHREALLGAREALGRARQALQQELAPECVAADLREATACLETLLGQVSNEDILDKIFAEFCLGK